MKRTFLILSLALSTTGAVVACSGGDIAVGSTNQDLKKTADGGATGDGGACSWDGVTGYDPTTGATSSSGSYAIGETFPAPDGCNTCTCTTSGIACTALGCVVDGGAPDSGGSCTYDLKTYASGATFPSVDGCSQCNCKPDGTVFCESVALVCMYTCPSEKVIDCMPIVPPERQTLCSGPYHDWLAANCGVTFAD